MLEIIEYAVRQTSNFRDIFIEVQAEVENTPEHREMLAQACATTPADHPRLWRALEHLIAHKAERALGITIPSWFDWAKIKEWLKNNWPQLVGLAITIIMLFI